MFQKGHPRRLVPELSKLFYGKSWLFNSAGCFTVRQANNVYVASSSAHPDALTPDDLYVVKAEDGAVLQVRFYTVN